ncbi:MAG: caspase family protein [Chloroflexia bacterium]|nr:caspase family protein [Chloroflexia bacterium]
MEITVKNTGNGIGKTVNLDVLLDSEPVKGFKHTSSKYVGNMIDGKEYTFELELFPQISMANGKVRFKVEALETNGYNSKPSYFSVNLESKRQTLAVGWINPLEDNSKVYEPEIDVRFCIVSAEPVKSYKLYLNGELYSDSRGMKLIKSTECDYEFESKVKLRNGVNRLYLELSNGRELVSSETRFVTYSEKRLEHRLALIIGNGKYAMAPLRNPPNDAIAMAKALRALDFEVIEVIDGDKREINDALKNFNDRLEQNKGVGLFYYAGHGIQIKGENYLVPIGHNIEHEADVEDEGVRINKVLTYMQNSGTRMNIVILDACRDNPYATRSARSGSRGLAQIYAEGSGSLIAYATSPGSVAADGEGNNGLYTQELLKAIETPGLEIGMIFRKVLTNVKKSHKDNKFPGPMHPLKENFILKDNIWLLVSENQP